jgi:hypothetical protein
MASKKKPPRRVIFQFKRYWKPAPPSYYEKHGLSPLSKLSIPRHIKKPNSKTIAAPTKAVDALTKSRGTKRQGFIDKLRNSAETAQQRLAPVSDRVSRADNIVENLTIVQPSGPITTQFKSVATRNKIKERNYAMRMHFMGNSAPLKKWMADYSGDYTVTDIHGNTYSLITNPDELNAARSQLSKKQRKRLQERYSVEAAD